MSSFINFAKNVTEFFAISRKIKIIINVKEIKLRAGGAPYLF